MAAAGAAVRDGSPGVLTLYRIPLARRPWAPGPLRRMVGGLGQQSRGQFLSKEVQAVAAVPGLRHVASVVHRRVVVPPEALQRIGRRREFPPACRNRSSTAASARWVLRTWLRRTCRISSTGAFWPVAT